MENYKTESKLDNYGGKFAYAFVFLTILIGTSAVVPVSPLNEASLLEGYPHSASVEERGIANIQTGRYLKVPSRF